MLLLWDIDDGFGGQIDKYMEHTNIDIPAGAFMAYGLINSGITNEMDPVSAVLTEKLVCPEDKLKIELERLLRVVHLRDPVLALARRQHHGRVRVECWLQQAFHAARRGRVHAQQANLPHRRRRGTLYSHLRCPVDLGWATKGRAQ